MTTAKKVSKKKLAEPMDEMESDAVGNAAHIENEKPVSKKEESSLAEKIQKIADHLVFLEKKLDNLLEQSKTQGSAPRPSFGGDRPSYQGNRPSGFQGNREGSGFRGNSSGGYRGNRDSGGGGFRGNRDGGSGGGGYQKFGNKPYFNKGGSSSYGGGSQGGGYRPGGPSRDRGGESRPSYNKGGAQGGEPGNA